MQRSPNPMDPLDDLKRWWESLWPVEQLGAIIAAAAVIALLGLWVFR